MILVKFTRTNNELHNVGPHRGGGFNSEDMTKEVLPMTKQDQSSRTSDQVNAVRVHSDPKFAKIRDAL